MYLNIIEGRHWDYSARMFNFLRYFQTAKQSICLIYSHVNPIILLVVLRPFRVMVKKIYIYLFKSHENGFGFIDEKTSGKNFRGNPNGASTELRKKGTMALLRKAASMIFLIVAAFMIFLVTSWVTLNSSLLYLGNSQLELNHFEEKTVYKERVLNSLQFSDFHLDESYKYKKLCAEKHGRFQFHFMRCYFLTQHSGYDERTMETFIFLCPRSLFYQKHLITGQAQKHFARALDI